MKIILAIPLFVMFVYILYLRAKIREFDVIYDKLLKCLNAINDRIKEIGTTASINSNNISELYKKIDAMEITEYYIPKDK